MRILLVGALSVAALSLSACAVGNDQITTGANTSAATLEAGLSVYIGLANQRYDTAPPTGSDARTALNTLDTRYAAVAFARLAFDAGMAARGEALAPALEAARVQVDRDYIDLRARLARIVAETG